MYNGLRLMFSHDTYVLIKAENENIVNRKMNRIIKELQTWFHANDLMINTEAFSFMLGNRCHV
jgi:hypothetical protein